LEEAVLCTLRDNLMSPEHVAEFVEAYHAEMNAKAATVSAERESAELQLVRTKKQIDTIIDTICEGFRTDGMKERLEDLDVQKKSLERRLSQPAPSTIRLHPALPQLYREKVQRLAESLSEAAIRDQAITLLRQLIEAVTVLPTEDGWEVEVKGEIGRMTNLAEGKTEQNQCSVKVVAGAGFEPTTFRL
jgi:site-specific DNA recombinase